MSELSLRRWFIVACVAAAIGFISEPFGIRQALTSAARDAASQTSDGTWRIAVMWGFADLLQSAFSFGWPLVAALLLMALEHRRTMRAVEGALARLEEP